MRANKTAATVAATSKEGADDGVPVTDENANAKDGVGIGERRRPKRKASENVRTRRKNAPSSVHYVGYVEDDESVEAIMKKFEIMEEIKEEHKKKQDEARLEREEAAAAEGEGEGTPLKDIANVKMENVTAIFQIKKKRA